jgi:outer membrane cobalamin receptor
MRTPSRRWLTLAAVAFSAAAAHADAEVSAAEAASAAPSGSLVGSVRTSDGLALPGVAVVLEGGRGERRVTAGPDGSYRVAALAAGSYSPRVDAPGLALRDAGAVTIGSTEERHDLVLVPAPVRERVVVSATRGEATLGTLGVAVEVLDRERIDERAAPSLLPLLSEVPGVATARSGQTGQQGSAFVRGGESRFARVMVDGVAVNQPGGAYDFGTALPFELERIEVVRGAASSLYGSDALAGVVSLKTRRAREGEAPSLRAEAEGGSFDWQRYSGASSGTSGGVDWNAGVQRLTTDNDAPNSRFEGTAAALSLGARLDPRTEARAVVRYEDALVGTPGPTAYGRPDLDASFERDDLLVSASLRRSGTSLSQTLELGYARTDQASRNPEDSGCFVPEWEGVKGAYPYCDFPNPEGFQNQTDRLAAGYQADMAVGARHLLSAGGELEHETGAIGNRAEALVEPERTSFGIYLQDRVLAGRRAYLTLGARLERNGSYGTHAVPRAALALRLREGEDATTLRASAGKGIKEPSFLESYGESFFARGNPDLEPERSTTFDVGVEQRLLASRLRASLTYFHHDYRDQIAYTVVDFTTFEGTYVNLAHTRAQGIEAALEARPVAALALFGQYTWTDGEILESPSDFDPVYAEGRALLRRPAHQASFSAQLTAGRVGAGASVVYVGERADSDFVGLGLATDPAFRNPGYTRLDARLRVRLAGALEAYLVGENLTDAAYEEALGYPAAGRSLRGGLRLRVGGGRRP